MSLSSNYGTPPSSDGEADQAPPISAGKGPSRSQNREGEFSPSRPLTDRANTKKTETENKVTAAAEPRVARALASGQDTLKGGETGQSTQGGPTVARHTTVILLGTNVMILLLLNALL